MSLKTITVNGKELTAFDKYDGTDVRVRARRLLAYHDEIAAVEEGGGNLTCWIRQTTLQFFVFVTVSFFVLSP